MKPHAIPPPGTGRADAGATDLVLETWNEEHLDQIACHLAAAVTDQVEWNHPRDSFTGVDAPT